MLILPRELREADRAQAYRLRKDGKLHQLARGAYVTNENWRQLSPRQQKLLRVVAHCKTRPGHIAIGRTAAFVLGLPTPTGGNKHRRIELGSVNGARSTSTSEVVIRHLPRRYRGQAVEVTTEFGVVFISSPQALAAELLLWCSQLEGLVAIEAMLHQRKLTIDAVASSLEFMKRRRGKSRNGRSAQDIAKETLMLITDCSESPRESEVKYELWKAGFPAPYQQVDIFKAKLSNNWVKKTDFLGRVDFMFPCGLVVEYDGRDKYLDSKSSAYFDVDGAYSSARLCTNGAYSSARLGKIDPQKIMEERQRERRIQNQGFEVIRIDAESFKEGAWLSEVRQSLERRRAEGRIAPEGKWHARAWAWADRSGR